MTKTKSTGVEAKSRLVRARRGEGTRRNDYQEEETEG